MSKCGFNVFKRDIAQFHKKKIAPEELSNKGGQNVL